MSELGLARGELFAAQHSDMQGGAQCSVRTQGGMVTSSVVKTAGKAFHVGAVVRSERL